MSTIATQRKPITISYVTRKVQIRPNYVWDLAYLKTFLRDNPNEEGMVTITGEDWTDVSRWLVNNPDHPQVDQIRVLVLKWRPFQPNVTIVKDDVVLTLDSLMVEYVSETKEFIDHDFSNYADRYSQHC